jgi:small Trp-rich protein
MRTTEEFAMWFLMLGLLGVALKLLEVGFVAGLSWWIVLIPFALAVVWWAWADASGYTKRKVIEKENARRQERIDRQRSNLGMLGSRSNRHRRSGR